MRRDVAVQRLYNRSILKNHSLFSTSIIKLHSSTLENFESIPILLILLIWRIRFKEFIRIKECLENPPLEKSDLKYEYKWETTDNDNPKKRELDSFLLNKSEGYEVLYFINDFICDNFPTKTDAEKKAIELEIERLIHDKNGIGKRKSDDINDLLLDYIMQWLRNH